MAQLSATPPTNRFGGAQPDSRKRNHNGVMGADASVALRSFHQSLYAAGYSTAMTEYQACYSHELNQHAAQVASLQHDNAELRAESMQRKAAQAAAEASEKVCKAAQAAAEASEKVCKAEAAKAAKQAAKQVAEATEKKSRVELELANHRAEATAKRKSELDGVNAVHKATVFRTVERQVAERRREDKKAAAKLLKAAEVRVLQGAAALAEVTAMAELQVETLNRSIGQYKRKLEPLRAAEAKRAAAGAQTGTARINAVAVAKELEAGRGNDVELRRANDALQRRVDSLESKLRDVKASSVKLITPRTSNTADAPLTARTLELLRRLCDETNCSIRGASTAIALVLELFIEGGPTEAQLISNVAIKAAFERLGMVDEDRERVLNQMSKQYWAMGADGGNKGRAMEMMAYSIWDEIKGKPVVKPLAASDLHANQTAANGMATHLRAVEHLGLKPEYCTAFSTDGTTHALQDAEGTLESLHQKAVEAAKASEDERISAIANCCIHGKALEENGGLEAMWPGERVVGALLLLWEVIKSPEGGRRAEYRETWCVDCGFDGALFDATLGSMAKPTSSKWQIMHDIIKALLPILQPIAAPHPQALMGAAATPSYLERFLDVNAKLNRGTMDSLKPARVAHPHCMKVSSPGSNPHSLTYSTYLLTYLRSLHPIVTRRHCTVTGGLSQSHMCVSLFYTVGEETHSLTHLLTYLLTYS
jgi:hypothetical protein